LSLISTYFAENSVMTSRRGLVWQLGGLLLLLTVIYAPILSAMVEHWRIVPDYSHGFLIVPLAFIFAYEKKYLLQAATIKGSWWGVGLLAVGLSLLALGQLGSLLAPLRAGYVFSMMGLVLLLLGKDAFFLLLFPMAFLLMMVPLPQSVVNIIHLAGGDLFVAEACSGLRSLMALLTLGIVFAHFFRRESLFQQVLLVASTIPIAIVVNSLRVAVTGILAHTYGQETATGFIHEFQGIITFSLAFLLLLGESKILARLLDRRKDGGTA